MKFKTLLLTLALTGAVLWVWHVLTPAQTSPTEDIRTEEIRKELRNSRKKRVGLILETPAGSSHHQPAAKAAQPVLS